jgi:type II secretory pathway pseudopilin PulG
MRVNNRHFRPAFTLIELLTVIGIIILLIGILLPVLASIRRAAWATDSQAAISNLAAACERYRQDFSAYPGVIPNTAFTASTGLLTTPITMTMTENCVLSLLGGWEPDPATVTNPASYVPAQVGNGPMGHTPILPSRRRYQPYFDANFGSTVQGYTSGTTWNQTAMTTANSNQYDSVDNATIPEFIDKFPDAMPIIYLRARTGTQSFSAIATLTMDATTQYNPNLILPYIEPDTRGSTTRTPFPGNKKFPGSSEDTNFNGTLDAGEDADGNGRLSYDFSTDGGVTGSVGKYFQNPGVTNEVRQKDGFWLIGAGPDRKFGTRDDQTNFGPIQ